MLKEIRAIWECSLCGLEFSVRMEPPHIPPANWTLFDCALDAVRGSLDYRGPSADDCQGLSFVDKDRALCDRCASTWKSPNAE